MLQHYIKKHKESIFENNQLPQLLYITNTSEMKTYFPRMLHKHDEHLEIVFIVKGCGKHLIGGTKYDTKAGDILIFNPGVIHDETAQSNSDMVTYTCGVTNLKIKGMDKNILFDISSPAVISSREYQDIIEKSLDIMLFHVTEKTDNANEICRYLLSSLLTLIVKLPRQPNTLFFCKKLTLIDQAKHYIETHYAERLTLQDIASRFNVSAYYLSRLFKEKTDFSPIQYLNRRRIGEAQSLLMTTNYSITQISDLVGYEDISYFSAVFSKMTGISPSLYRTLWIGRTLS